jgi:quinol monooxygenase YgiN
MSKFGLYNKIPTQPGKRDEFVELLLEAAAAMQQLPGCDLYLVNVSASEPDVVWVTEVWESAEAHQTSLSLESAKAAIERGIPLIAGPIESIKLVPMGGKGLSRV